MGKPAGLAQKDPIGLPDGSFGFVLRSVVRNRKYRWASQRDSQKNLIGIMEYRVFSIPDKTSLANYAIDMPMLACYPL